METNRVKIYLDSGADISYLKPYFERCKFSTFPYDSPHRRKKAPKPKLARPSEAQWRDCHATWGELDFPWNEFRGSSIHNHIKSIVGAGNRQDILHLDSAFKESVDLFLTSDKDDIWTKRKEIEAFARFQNISHLLRTSSNYRNSQNPVINTLVFVVQKWCNIAPPASVPSINNQ